MITTHIIDISCFTQREQKSDTFASVVDEQIDGGNRRSAAWVPQRVDVSADDTRRPIVAERAQRGAHVAERNRKSVSVTWLVLAAAASVWIAAAPHGRTHREAPALRTGQRSRRALADHLIVEVLPEICATTSPEKWQTVSERQRKIITTVCCV